jgi:hypothetical protein
VSHMRTGDGGVQCLLAHLLVLGGLAGAIIGLTAAPAIASAAPSGPPSGVSALRVEVASRSLPFESRLQSVGTGAGNGAPFSSILATDGQLLLTNAPTSTLDGGVDGEAGINTTREPCETALVNPQTLSVGTISKASADQAPQRNPSRLVGWDTGGNARALDLRLRAPRRGRNSLQRLHRAGVYSHTMTQLGSPLMLNNQAFAESLYAADGLSAPSAEVSVRMFVTRSRPTHIG